jgi:hypothetical protein
MAMKFSDGTVVTIAFEKTVQGGLHRPAKLTEEYGHAQQTL